MKPARTKARLRPPAHTFCTHACLSSPPPPPSDDLRRWRKPAHNATATFIPSDACIITTPSFGASPCSLNPASSKGAAGRVSRRDQAPRCCSTKMHELEKTTPRPCGHNIQAAETRQDPRQITPVAPTSSLSVSKIFYAGELPPYS